MRLINTICSVVSPQAHRFAEEKLAFHQAMIGRQIERELQIAVHDGVSEFRVGMNMGADIWVAARILRLRDHEFPDLRLYCYLPCETQANHWPEHWREQYFDILAKADEVLILQSRYSRGCMARRSTEMLQGSGRLIAVHDNVAGGGIDRTVSYAEAKGIETIVLQPLEGPPVPRVLSNYSSNRLRLSSAYAARSSTGRSAINMAR
ncbi:MAG: DUF1273 domain-containing protein [Oscillospiraceae bacterium]|nr:DUF1273 domain-containing protein [Oscillospiraceae bacterium]